MLTDRRSDRRAFLGGVGSAAAAAALTGPLVAADPAPQNQVISAVTLIHGLPGRDEDLQQHLLSLARPTRAEAGCVTYDLYQSPDQKHEFMRFEVWTSLEALEVHKRTPHIRASFDKRDRKSVV